MCLNPRLNGVCFRLSLVTVRDASVRQIATRLLMLAIGFVLGTVGCVRCGLCGLVGFEGYVCWGLWLLMSCCVEIVLWVMMSIYLCWFTKMGFKVAVSVTVV